MYLNHMGLTWHGAYEYLNTNIGDQAALEAAGVQGKINWQLTGDKGWQKEVKSSSLKPVESPRWKRQWKEKEDEEENDEEPPEAEEPLLPTRR